MVAFSKLMLLSSSISRSDGLQVRAAGQQSDSAGKQRRATSAEIGVCSPKMWSDCSRVKDPEQLLVAVEHCSFDQVTSLLKRLDDTAKEGSTALHLASKLGRDDVVQYLLDEEWEVSRLNEERSTALHLASACGHTTIVELLSDKGCDVEEADTKSRTALHLASEKGHLQVVEALVKIAKANPEYLKMKDYEHKTALHLASEKGHLQVVKALVEIAKADPEYLKMTDAEHKTALQLASEKENLQVVQALVRNECDLDVQGKQGLPYEGILQLLVEKGCRDPNAIDHRGFTALHYAVIPDVSPGIPVNCDSMEKLLDVDGIEVDQVSSASDNHRQWYGKTPLDVAKQHERGVCKDLGVQPICPDVCRRLSSNQLNQVARLSKRAEATIRRLI